MILDYKGVSLRITVPRDVTDGCVLRVGVPFRAVEMLDACRKIQAAVRKHVLSPRSNATPTVASTPQEVARRWVLSEHLEEGETESEKDEKRRREEKERSGEICKIVGSHQ